jgi:PAS domain S-box-containing protein
VNYLDARSTDLSHSRLPPKAPRPLQFTLSIRMKLLGLVIFLLLILGFSAYFLHNALHGSLHFIERQANAIQMLQATTRAEKSFTNVRWSYLSFLSTPTDENYANVKDRLESFRAGLSLLKTSELQSQAARIDGLVTQLEKDADNLKTIQIDTDEATAFETDATRNLSSVDEGLNTMVIQLEDMLTQTSQATRQETSALRTIPLVFLIGGLLTFMFATVVAILQVFIPIGKITRMMAAASSDTVNARDYALPVPRYDEVGMATEALNSLLFEVSSGIERISSTERRLRETSQYLQAIMDNVVDGLITLNELGRVETFSPSAEKLFERTAQEAIGVHISTLLFDHKGAAVDLVAQIMSKPSDFFSLSPSELLARTKADVMIPVELAVGQTGFAGRTMYVVTVRDISSRKQMETFIEQAQRMETVGRMTGGIAHDFNNMLTVISGNFELIDMKLKTADPLLKAMVQMGLETVRKGKDMTQRLLAISSKQLLKPEVIVFTDRLPGVIEMIQRAVQESIELRTVIPDDVWNIRVDPVQFESALLNLAINARDAMTGPSGRITIEVANALFEENAAGLNNVKPGAYVSVAVNDNGTGIPASIIDRVLEPFFTTKPGSKGTGLGLSMVYGFTRQSGGFLTIDSVEGKGTSIKLFFPRSEEKFQQAALASHQEQDQKIPTGTESLLVVEDSPDVLRYLTQTLRELGYRVTYASDASMALKKLGKRKTLDLLVTDVVMPGEMNGEMLAHEARLQLPDLKVLYISGYTRDALVEQGALKTGVTLLAKPFTRADLAWHVRKVLDAA